MEIVVFGSSETNIVNLKRGMIVSKKRGWAFWKKSASEEESCDSSGDPFLKKLRQEVGAAKQRHDLQNNKSDGLPDDIVSDLEDIEKTDPFSGPELKTDDLDKEIAEIRQTLKRSPLSDSMETFASSSDAKNLGNAVMQKYNNKLIKRQETLAKKEEQTLKKEEELKNWGKELEKREEELEKNNILLRKEEIAILKKVKRLETDQALLNNKEENLIAGINRLETDKKTIEEKNKTLETIKQEINTADTKLKKDRTLLIKEENAVTKKIAMLEKQELRLRREEARIMPKKRRLERIEKNIKNAQNLINKRIDITGQNEDKANELMNDAKSRMKWIKDSYGELDLANKKAASAEEKITELNNKLAKRMQMFEKKENQLMEKESILKKQERANKKRTAEIDKKIQHIQDNQQKVSEALVIAKEASKYKKHIKHLKHTHDTLKNKLNERYNEQKNGNSLDIEHSMNDEQKPRTAAFPDKTDDHMNKDFSELIDMAYRLINAREMQEAGNILFILREKYKKLPDDHVKKKAIYYDIEAIDHDIRLSQI